MKYSLRISMPAQPPTRDPSLEKIILIEPILPMVRSPGPVPQIDELLRPASQRRGEKVLTVIRIFFFNEIHKEIHLPCQAKTFWGRATSTGLGCSDHQIISGCGHNFDSMNFQYVRFQVSAFSTSFS
jgi:hypothetical protein